MIDILDNFIYIKRNQMLSYDQSISSFTTMSYDQKKKKVISMLEVLKEEWNIFDDLWDLIHVWDTVSESVIDMIYQVITKAMYSLKEQEMEDAVENLERIKSKITKIKWKEAAERENAEELLNRI